MKRNGLQGICCRLRLMGVQGNYRRMIEIKSSFYQRHKRERKKKKSYCLNSTCVDKSVFVLFTT